MAKEAHTDGTRVVQCQSDDQNSMKTTIMQMPMDYLEIPKPSLPRGFLELAEEARNVNVEIEQCCSSVLNVGATIAPGISTERIPPIFSAGPSWPLEQDRAVGFIPDRLQKMEEPIPLAQWARMSPLTKFSQWLKAQWASISHVAQWAQTECFPRVIPISLWLMARWARRLY